MDTITTNDVREAISEAVDDIIANMEHIDTRDGLLERLDEENDTLFGQLVQQGLVTDYDIGDMVRTAPACGAILEVAEADSWVEDDSGLWEGVTYGLLACIAFFALRNCLHSEFERRGYDLNDSDVCDTIRGVDASDDEDEDEDVTA